MAAEDTLCGKGYELTLFVFTDIIVVAKVSVLFQVKLVVIRPFVLQRKAAKGMGMMRSPSTASLATVGQPALLTHMVREIWSLI